MNRLIHFTADWCQPCKKIAPIIETFINNNPQIRYEKIDIEEDFDTVKSYNVLSIPTLIAINNDQIVGRKTGVLDYLGLERLFEKDV